MKSCFKVILRFNTVGGICDSLRRKITRLNSITTFYSQRKSMWWFIGRNVMILDHLSCLQRNWSFFSTLRNGVRFITYFPIVISPLVAFNQNKHNETNILLYEKNPKFRACWCLQSCKCYCLVSLIWRCSCHDWVNELPNYLLQQFLHYFILFQTLGLAIYLKIR